MGIFDLGSGAVKEPGVRGSLHRVRWKDARVPTSESGPLP
jgi:hypothetical protein